jgi:hypothetical protein
MEVDDEHGQLDGNIEDIHTLSDADDDEDDDDEMQIADDDNGPCGDGALAPSVKAAKQQTTPAKTDPRPAATAKGSVRSGAAKRSRAGQRQQAGDSDGASATGASSSGAARRTNAKSRLGVGNVRALFRNVQRNRAQSRQVQQSLKKQTALMVTLNSVFNQLQDDLRGWGAAVSAISTVAAELRRDMGTIPSTGAERSLARVIVKSLLNMSRVINDGKRHIYDCLFFLNGMYEFERRRSDEMSDVEGMFLEHMCEMQNGAARQAMVQSVLERRTPEQCATVVPSVAQTRTDNVGTLWQSTADILRPPMLLGVNAAAPLNSFAGTRLSQRPRRNSGRSVAGNIVNASGTARTSAASTSSSSASIACPIPSITTFSMTR